MRWMNSTHFWIMKGAYQASHLGFQTLRSKFRVDRRQEDDLCNGAQFQDRWLPWYEPIASSFRNDESNELAWLHVLVCGRLFRWIGNEQSFWKLAKADWFTGWFDMVYVHSQRFRSVYEDLRREVMAAGNIASNVLVIVANDIDALCACRILTV